MSYFRQPHSTKERRAVIDAMEWDVHVRAKRMGNNLPNAWDDIPKLCQRSWKCFRKTKWK